MQNLSNDQLSAVSNIITAEQLGDLRWPIVFCSVLACAIIIERIVSLAYTHISNHKRDWLKQATHLLTSEKGSCKKDNKQCFSSSNSLARKAICLLLVHKNQNKALREEIAAVWLRQQQQKLARGLKALHILALISPLLGLLGTVLGLIEMFDALATSEQAVNPATLSQGLGTAMYTTAAGLLVTVPALAFAHGLSLWKERIIHELETIINQANLMIEGVNTLADDARTLSAFHPTAAEPKLEQAPA
ncbi:MULTISPECIES: MotA/TolQ/ExbB proton channel family protein [unclassified Agarivorans]|uniref:MotA/TolQ/ExbB proton channel family protein n=1 Tax=unclassified Agarivorans TaxID=2636026 RepID=UPI0010E79C3B|nr:MULTISPECIES: MotA/TolQ/ExbB proton channel family protein [unclassified Agarivorans]MDO6762835.1 MotA/TolQ/ExbB proton channel family protein [Agarivorans sp. 1_MG-2023]GDY24717.1 biopolymer transport protein exbB1 [Agarivorans sp. Toyoura001]